MKKSLILLAILIAPSIKLFGQAVVFSYTGAVQTYTVPPCVFFIDFIVKGGEGGPTGSGGDGATVTGTYAVTPGQVLEVYVGGMGTITSGGFNGGGIGKPGASGSGGGGGGSDIRVAPYALTDRFVAAGGGGGFGGGSTAALGGSGGDPNGSVGASSYGTGGGGGTTIAGGAGGAAWGSCGSAGGAGTLGFGGAGGTDNCYGLGPGGGGGGGLYGGGGGGADDYPSYPLGGGGGGGGSSLVPAGGTSTMGSNVGNGEITIIPAGGNPIVTVSPPAPTICDGTSVTLTASGALTYVWSPATGLSSTTGTSVVASPTVTTTYTVTGTDACGVGDTTVTVTVLPKPIIDFNLIPETCQGDDSASIIMTPIGTGPFTYTLDGVPGSGTFVPLAPGAYTVVVTDGNTCVNDSVITVVPGPACCTMVTTTSSTNVCPGICNGTASVTWTGNVSATPTINWLNSALVPIGQTTATATGLCAGTYYVGVSDSTLCTIYDTAVVGNFPGVTITSITAVNALCNGDCNGTLTINNVGGTLFSIDGGTSFQASNVFTNLCVGTYPVIVLNANGCSAVSSANITEPLPLLLVIDAITNTKCFGSADGAITTTASGGTSPYGISWSNGSTNLDNINIPAGPYTLNLTDANGCTATVSGTVTEPPVLVTSLVIDSTTCYQYCDGSATMTAGGGTAPYFYNWSGGIAPNTSTVAANLCVGTYNITVVDANACSNFTNFTVAEPVQVQVGVVTVKDEKCYASCDGYIVINGSTGTQFSINGGMTYFANNTFLNLCEGTYSVFVRDNDGCMNNTTVTVDRPLEIISEFTFGPQPIDFFQTEITFDNLSLNANLYTWYYATLGTSNVYEEVYEFPSYVAGEYLVCLKAANDSGCYDSTCHTVVIDDYTYLYLPNAFTPDGNGTNDIFKPVINYIEESTYVFRIFNRWGETIFMTNNVNEGWDGLHKSMKAKEDVYVWKVKAKSKLNSEVKEWTGHVNLLR